ncbi:lipopolysaccharide heptosyltransferase II [bacterium]|nr:lipopolysaccharide heptosyltransferase II [bacterium]MBU1071683.1 lipopolysaccharide heptosyltransferase II [bacterium]MBU1675556.1 lipopolysaccharide heptosyltransferase II [bacterium]
MARRMTLLLAAPNWLGDLVMATSLLELFAAGERDLDLPCPDLHVSVREAWLPLLADDPRLSGVIRYSRRGRHAGWRGVWRQAAEWRRGKYPAVMLLPPSLRAAVVARISGIPARIGFRGDARSLLLTAPVARPPRGTMHYTEELGLLYRAWARDCLGCQPPAHPVPPYPRLGAGVANPGERDVDSKPPLWLLSVGATYGDAKSWPPQRQAELIAELLARDDVRVALIGDIAASGTARRVRSLVDRPWRDRLGEQPGCHDLVGRTSLVEVASLLREAAVFVGNDSGLMHLAAALGKATVGIYGSTSTAWTRPRGPAATSVRAEGFPCQPCYLPSCPRESFCLDSIAARRILGAADALSMVPGSGPSCCREPPPDTPGMTAAPILFLDRDGVIIEDTEYISDPARVRLLPGVAAALARAAAAGLRLVVVTNQSGIGRGYYSEREFAAVQERVDALLAAEGVALDGVYYCPHAPEDDCNCRKPRPGMLDAAARRLRWHSERAWIIGDKLSDLELGRHFGMGTYLVETGRGRETARDVDPVWRVKILDDLARAVDDILGELNT